MLFRSPQNPKTPLQYSSFLEGTASSNLNLNASMYNRSSSPLRRSPDKALYAAPQLLSAHPIDVDPYAPSVVQELLHGT